MKSNGELNMAVCEKLMDEYEKFKEWLITLEPREILNYAYEYAIRQDISYATEYTEFTNEQCEALLKSPDITQEAMKIFDHLETDYMSDLAWCVEHAADLRIQKEKEAMRE